ncbi:MAG: winged helix-turn-helix domain-containing protein [Ilumatobacteraceae bacterium]
MLRRTGAGSDSVLTCADLELDDDAHRVTKAGVDVELSPTEYNLLRYLLVNQGRVLSKAQILDHVWQYDFGGEGGIVETYVGYLRRKLDHEDPRLIHTLRGVGYTLRAAAGLSRVAARTAPRGDDGHRRRARGCRACRDAGDARQPRRSRR